MAAVMAAVLLTVLAPVLASPAGGAQEGPEQFTLTMPEGEGAILIRGAEEPAPLESPTTIAGTNDGGAITDGVFSSPPISFEREVTAAGVSTVVEITARFSEVSPGSVEGSINDTGDIALEMDLRVDLDIYVDVLNSTFECVASPVDLELRSVTPYDPADGGSVVLRDANFSVPAVPVTDDCVEIVASGVNAELAGSGHSLTVPMTGVITPPPFPGEPTDTALVVSPSSSDQGEPVTLSATVSADPEGDGEGTPTGTVDFLDGTTAIGSATLSPEGIAVLTTGDLAPGTRRLRAVYRGVPETWDDSASAVVPHRVSATPLLSADMPATVQVGGSAVDLQLAVTNTGLGSPLSGLDLAVTLERPDGEGDSTIGPDGGTPRIVLSRVVGGVATPVASTLEGSPPDEALTGTILPAGSWELPAGAERVEDLTLQVSGATDPGPLQVTFSLVRPGSGGNEPQTVASSAGQIAMVPATRQATTVVAGDEFFFPPIVPTAARQGSALDVNQVVVLPLVGGRDATGTFEFLIDGVPAPSRLGRAPSDVPYARRSPVEGSQTYSVQIPPATPTGIRQVTIRYSGDEYFAPSQAQYPVRIEAAVGPTYECVWKGTISYRTIVNVQAQASLPATWPSGTTAAITDMDVRMVLARTSSWLSVGSNFSQPEAAEQEFSFGLGPDGGATATSVLSENWFAREFEDGSDIDHTITFGGISGSASVDGAPGEVVDVTLDSIEIDIIRDVGVDYGSATITCTPVGEAVVLDQVTAAGTTLAVAPAGPVATGTPVTLTATTLPVAAGSVEFRDGTTTIGVLPVGPTGVATLVTDELPPGRRSLTAVYRPAALGPVTRSEPVELLVVGDCTTTPVEPGSGAVVRLVYIELLGRCPDPTGYAHWKSRLDGGTSPEAFARAIARTPEAVGRVVDDAYQTMLGRAPDPAGRAFWTRRLQGHGRYDQLLADLAASSEFWNLSGRTNTGFVTRIYDRVLHRSPDPSGRDHWVGRLQAGTSRRTLVLTLANLGEPLRVLVDDAYGDLLDRAPDATERAEGVDHLRSTGDRSALSARLIGTPEFADRAQGFPELA